MGELTVLIKLGGRGLRPLAIGSEQPFVGRICSDPGLAVAERGSEILLTDDGELPRGFRAYLVPSQIVRIPDDLRDVYRLGEDFHYLAPGDVVRIEPQRSAIRTLYRRNSRSNSFLVTERCDNYCVMCSQPPKQRDDSWLVDELMEVLPLVSPDTVEIGITGGEPSLLGDRLIALIALCKQLLPRTAVHVLSNGRRFSTPALARVLAAVQHPDLMLGIPLYADVADVHDYVVQARGAFDQTVRGILNLKQHGVRVELRFVIHADTVERMVAFARFVARNLLFVDHVALMGLELMGFARANLDAIWIDPLDYQHELREAVDILDRSGVFVSIYNHPLCVLDPYLQRFARASISDWKNAYLAECEQCALRSECGGLFASSQLRRSRGIAAVPAAPQPA
jgi:His-Xaa-Ser system radical SAM maturase HxsC